MIGLVLASHTFLQERENRRCKKLGHRSTPDQEIDYRRCRHCLEAMRVHKKPKKLFSSMLKTLKHADIEKPPKKNKSPSLTSSSSSEFLNYTFPSSNPKLAESSTQHESGVVSRAYRLVETRDLANKIYREVYEDRWDAETNPQGKIDLCTAENNLCQDLLEEKLNDPKIWSGAIKSLYHYAPSGGFDWVKQAAINYVEHFISKVGDPGILPENITIVPGCHAAYDMIGFCLFEPGDAILSFVPFYSRLIDNLEERAQVRVVPINFKNFTNPHFDVQSLEEAFQRAEQQGIKVRAISIVNPHNPLGIVFNESELLAVCKWAVTKDLFILADEVFATTISPQNTTQFRSLLSIRHQLGVKQRRKVIWMWSVSKDLCLSGARFGLIHTENKDLQKALRRLEIMQPCAPVVQHLMGSLFSDLNWFTKFNEIKNSRLTDNRRFVMEKLDEYSIPYLDAHSALFLFINLSEYIENDTPEAEQKLWKRFTRTGVYLNPGCLMSNSECGWFRLVISIPKAELEEGIKRMHAILLVVDKRQIGQKSVLKQETLSQPVSSATSEDELMKLIFPKSKKDDVIPTDSNLSRADISIENAPKNIQRTSTLLSDSIYESIFEPSNTTIQSSKSELPSQYTTTIDDASLHRNEQIDSQVRVQDNKIQQKTITYTPSLPADVFETIFNNDGISSYQQSGTKLQPFEKSLTSKGSDAEKEGLKYTTTKHDSGIETDYKLSIDAKHEKSSPTSPQISETQHFISDDVYESIFKSTENTQSAMQQPELSQDFDTQNKREQVEETTFSDDQQTNKRKASEDILDKVFQSVHSMPSFSPDVFEKPATDVGTFSESLSHEQSTSSLPTLTDEQMQKIFEPGSNIDKKKSKSREDVNQAEWDRISNIEENMDDSDSYQITTKLQKVGEPTMTSEEIGSILEQLWPKDNDGLKRDKKDTQRTHLKFDESKHQFVEKSMDDSHQTPENETIATTKFGSPIFFQQATSEVNAPVFETKAEVHAGQHQKSDDELTKKSALTDEVYEQIFKEMSLKPQKHVRIEETNKEKDDDINKQVESKAPAEILEETDEEYTLKPLLTDFSFIEELVNESIMRRKQQQYRPEIDQYRLSIVDEVSETSATPKDSTGSPISTHRHSLRESLKDKSIESPLNEDIFNSSIHQEHLLESTSDKINEESANNESIEPPSPKEMRPLHIDVDSQPLETSTLKRDKFNQQKQYEMNDSGIGIDASSGSSTLTIEFPVLYSSKKEVTDSPHFTKEDLTSLLNKSHDHWPQKLEESAKISKSQSVIEEYNLNTEFKLSEKSDENAQVASVYSEADIWEILGSAKDRQEKRESPKGSKKQILRKRWSESSGGLPSDSTYDAKKTSVSSTDSINLDIRMRSISPSSVDERNQNRKEIPKQKIYRRHQSTGPSSSNIIDIYNNSVKSTNQDVELFPKVRVTSHHPRYKKTSNVKYLLSKSQDSLTAENSQVHHTMYMRRPKSASPHGNKRQVVLQHTNITEIVYDSSDNIKELDKPELIKTKASTRVNSLSSQDLLNSLVFDTEKEPTNETSERYVEFRRVKSKDRGAKCTKTDIFDVKRLSDNKNKSRLASYSSDSQSAEDLMEFERTKSGRTQRGIQTSDKLNLCCEMRVIKKGSAKEILKCKNLSHSDLHDHCNPKRVYIVKSSTIPKESIQNTMFADPNDVLTVSNVSDTASSNSIDRIVVQHTPGSRWMVSSVCKTTKYGFDKQAVRLSKKDSGLKPIRSKLYSARSD